MEFHFMTFQQFYFIFILKLACAFNCLRAYPPIGTNGNTQGVMLHLKLIRMVHLHKNLIHARAHTHQTQLQVMVFWHNFTSTFVVGCLHNCLHKYCTTRHSSYGQQISQMNLCQPSAPNYDPILGLTLPSHTSLTPIIYCPSHLHFYCVPQS